jgi:hypothetical protein
MYVDATEIDDDDIDDEGIVMHSLHYDDEIENESIFY